jgi:hypothetical protein
MSYENGCTIIMNKKYGVQSIKAQYNGIGNEVGSSNCWTKYICYKGPRCLARYHMLVFILKHMVEHSLVVGLLDHNAVCYPWRSP